MTQVRPRVLATKATYQRAVLGIVVTLGGLAMVLAVLLPFRPHLSIAIPALLFVLPALVGVVIGGFLPGAAGALVGFLVYDFFFLPPYNTFTVRSPQNWIALAVYVVVVLIVAQVVAKQRSAREEALRRTEEARRLFELSQALIGDLSLLAAPDPHGRHRAERVRAPLDRPRAARRRWNHSGTRWDTSSGCHGGPALGGGRRGLRDVGRGRSPIARTDGRHRAPPGVGGAGCEPPAGRHARASGRAAD